jgi:hypothetical protein
MQSIRRPITLLTLMMVTIPAGPAKRLKKGSHVEYKHCEGVAPGDTIEVHWVYTTCDTETKGAKPQ